MKLKPIPEPLNANERLLYAIVMRQDILIEQLSSIVEHISKKDNVAVEDSKVVESVVEPVKKEVAKEEEKPKPTTRKRTAKVKE
jgi:uncharacterized protein (DUF1697 family)